MTERAPAEQGAATAVPAAPPVPSGPPAPVQRGFTLLEVMVALAILAVSLTALLGTQSSSVVLSRYITETSVATMLARGKILDLEHKLKKDGFDAFGEDTESGNFGDEGHPEMKWEALIEKIEVDESAVQSISQDAPQTREDVVGKLSENPQLQGMDLSNINFNPGMIFTFLPTAIEMLGEKVRKCTLTVSWRDGNRTRSLVLQTYFVQYEEFTEKPASLEEATGKNPEGEGGK